ncbi:MAG TPA: hypothetical protein VFE05_19920 [Longimicrobiaceae bacterium]|jgi:hypothetical protein|nr:hypothetical protein [Longimicrobiaceae bacterium]
MKNRIKAGLLALVVGLAACSGDSTGPSNAKLSGAWSFSVSNLSGSGLANCNVAGLTLNLTQSGSSFSGTYTPGTLTCPGVGATSFSGGTVVNGTVNGNNVTFNLDDPSFHNTGTLNGSGISGTTLVQTSSGNLTGTFSAVKQ